jgi:hypothetical protein
VERHAKTFIRRIKMRKIFAAFIVVCAVGAALFAQTPTPASEFKYDLTKDGEGIAILQFTGGSANVVIPAEIEGFPVLEIHEEAFAGFEYGEVRITGGKSNGSRRGRIEGARAKTLASVTIPDSVKSIGKEAFSGCKVLTSVTIGKSVTAIGESAFENCEGLTSLIVPDSVINIGNKAFSGCAGLTSVTIGNGVKSIGKAAFSGCKVLTSVTIGKSVTAIGESAFEKCKGLTSLIVPDSVINIGNKAFSGCAGLTSVTIGKSVTAIGEGAFASTGLTSVTIPDSVTSIGDYAFFGCERLTSVTISPIERRWGWGGKTFLGCSHLGLAVKAALKKAGYTGEFEFTFSPSSDGEI